MSQPQQSLEDYLQKAVADATSLRKGHTDLGPDATYVDVLDGLSDLRKRYDRVEEIYRVVLQMRSQATILKNQRQAEATDAWNRELMRIRRAPNREEYTGPRERYAEADLETLDEKIKSRTAEAVAESANTALECIRTILRGLDNTRQDHLTWLRALNFQSNLET